MSDKYEALRLEAETVSVMMIHMSDDDVGDTCFAVMSDLGENGTEHECDLDVSETALRASSVINQLLAALKEKDQRIAELETIATDYAAKFQKSQDAFKHAAVMMDDDKKRIAELEQRLQQFRIVGHVDNEGGEYTESYGELTESVAIGEKLYSADVLPNLELVIRKGGEE